MQERKAVGKEGEGQVWGPERAHSGHCPGLDPNTLSQGKRVSEEERLREAGKPAGLTAHVRHQPVCQSFQLERQRTHVGQHMLEKEEQRWRTYSSRFQNLLQSDSNPDSVVLAQGQADPYLTPYTKN